MHESANSYRCIACGWVYDPAQGDPDGGIAPGTSWESVPDDWVCPVCGAGKEDFERVDPAEARPPAAGPEPVPAVLIVGTGLAGYALAKELRRRNPDLPIGLVSADGGEVYTKPLLSNALARRQTPDDLVQKDAPAMARELNLEIRTRTRVLAIDRANRRVSIEGPEGHGSLAYGRLVLALGADPRVIPAPGSELVPIATVNDLDGYRVWRGRIGSGGRILLVGAGLIGCEFANDLALAGFDVALVDPAPRPLARLLPEPIGAMLAKALESVGCTLHLGRIVARYASADGRSFAELDDGTRVPFDQALSAVGLTPRTALAAAAGLEVAAGIRVDRRMRTSDPLIFALGDCAQTEVGPLPYIAPLLAQARAIAATLTGEETALRLPAMPVVVKTPALPLAVCPPPPESPGIWDLDLGEGEATALFYSPDGRPIGFVLAGPRTASQHALAREMPDLLPEETPRPEPAAAATRWECGQCGHVYDPAEGDPDSGIPPGTPWESVPDDWVCPLCGAGKDAFDPVL